MVVPVTYPLVSMHMAYCQVTVSGVFHILLLGGARGVGVGVGGGITYLLPIDRIRCGSLEQWLALLLADSTKPRKVYRRSIQI